MSLRVKLSIVALIEVIATAAIIGFFAFRQSKQETEALAREIMRAKTDYVFTLLETYDAIHGSPTEELIQRIRSVRLFDEGYITVLSNAPESRGVLLVHPSSEGQNLLQLPGFPHIKRIIDDIEASGRQHGIDKFILYQQGSDARGRRGEEKIGYYKYFAPWAWIVLTTSYTKDVYKSTASVRNGIIDAVIFVGLIAVILVNVTVQRMFRPLQNLTETIQEVAAGKLDASIAIESRDEIGGLARHFNNMLISLRQNTRVWQELEIARRLQQEMLPSGAPAIAGVDILAHSLPATEVGGDFYDFIMLDENRFAIIIGDVSGKGISGAMGMSSALSALRFAADIAHTTDKILEMVNRRLVRDIQRYMFVAVFLGIYDRREQKLFYTNAGQTMPFICDGEGVRLLPQSDADRFPLGIRPEVEYVQQHIALEPGMELVFYTDGIIELSDDNREPYGFDRLRESIIRHRDKSLPAQRDALLHDAAEFAGTDDYEDDVTLVLFRLE